MLRNSVYHEGELQVQERAGQALQARRSGSVISESIPKGALAFIQQQSLAAAASVDPQGNAWASILLGQPGFLFAPDPGTVEIDLKSNPLSPHDPLLRNIEHDRRLGLLIIDLSTRRRLRVNGDATRSRGRLKMKVAEAYPNCPKYIQRRHPRLGMGLSGRLGVQRGDRLTDGQVKAVQAADTLFVASLHPQRGLDASHRGGMPGFVQVTGDHTLRIPDYPGNSMFNTLGNLAVNPRAGLAFLDFARSRLLQVSGRAEILWGQAWQQAGATGLAWQVSVQHWLETPLPQKIEWELLDYSPFNPEVPELVGAD